jgi:hypothetical protein
VLVLLVKLPPLWVMLSTSVVEWVNVFSLGIERTVKTPLYPLFSVPAVLPVLVTFLIVIFSPTLMLCGISEMIVTVEPEVEQVLINLGFLLKSGSEVVMPVAVKSESDLKDVVLDS